MLGHGGNRGGEPCLHFCPFAHSNMINVLESHILIEDDVVKQKLNREINDFIRLFPQKLANCHCEVIKI